MIEAIIFGFAGAALFGAGCVASTLYQRAAFAAALNTAIAKHKQVLKAQIHAALLHYEEMKKRRETPGEDNSYSQGALDALKLILEAVL